jgi:hypothetical protein
MLLPTEELARVTKVAKVERRVNAHATGTPPGCTHICKTPTEKRAEAFKKSLGWCCTSATLPVGGHVWQRAARALRYLLKMQGTAGW